MWHKVILSLPDKIRHSLCALFIFLPAWLQAQVGQNYFPAEPANLFEWRSSLVNPSIGAFQTGALDLSAKILYRGFIREENALFKTGYALLNIPRFFPAQFGLGLQAVTFSTPIYSENQIRLQLNRRFRGLFSLGVSFGLLNIAYRSENFDLIDADDPVFASGTSKWQLQTGAGITLILFHRVVVGAGVQYLNRPALTLLEDGPRMEPAIHVGVSFNLGALTFFGGSDQKSTTTTPRGAVQAYRDDFGLIQAGYQEESFWARGRLHVAGPISVGYGISLPTGTLKGTSAGSHEFELVYEFGRIREVPDMDIPPDDWAPFQPAMPAIHITPQFAVVGQHKAVDIYTKRIIREISPGLDAKARSRLTPFDLGILDTSFVEQFFPFELKEYPIPDSSAKLSGPYSSEYLSALKRLRHDLLNKDIKAVIVAPEHQKARALAFREYFRQAISSDSGEVIVSKPAGELSSPAGEYARPFSLPQKEEIVLFKPRSMNFTVFPITPRAEKLTWHLIIENAEGEIIRTFTSSHAVQNRVKWQWRRQDGNIIAPGFYRYYIEWEDDEGNRRRSPPNIFYARKLQRNIHIKITRKYEDTDGEIEKIGIILSK